MSNKVTYGLTALMGSNKGGVLKPDEDGYYSLYLGAFNAFNNSGDYYPLEPVEHLFREGSSLRRRLDNGTCYIENDHPSPLPGMDHDSWIRRVLKTEQKNVCGHVADVTLCEAKDQEGRAVISTLGKVCPSGVHSAALKASLDNPKENTCFSVRTLTRDSDMANGRKYKEIIVLVGWDRITEPGVFNAKKFLSPSLENLSVDVDVDMLLSLKKIASTSVGIGTESADIDQYCNEALHGMGYNENGTRKTFALHW